MIYQIFNQSFIRNPQGIALIDSKDNYYSYEDVSLKVNIIAENLKLQGVLENDKVMVLIDDEDNHYFYYLALDKIGAVYIPIDSDLPINQIHQCLENLSLLHIISDEKNQNNLDKKTLNIIDESQLIAPLNSLNCDEIKLDTYHQDPEKISYILSTSGSSGDKKWVPILGKGLIYWQNVLNNTLSLSPLDKVLATRSPGYDARIFEYLKALANGSTLVLVSKNQRKDFSEIIKVCEKHTISAMLFMASFLMGDGVLETIESLKAIGVKHLMVTGSACTPLLKSCCEQCGIFLWNAYGPTELTFGLSIIKVNHLPNYKDESGKEIVVIGKPYGNDVKLHIINESLHISSPYLTKGYINNSDEKPFSVTLENGQEIIAFDTEDKVLIDNDYLIYQGGVANRNFCKINGVKVSAHFIEQVLLNYQNLEAAVVIKNHNQQEMPVAYMCLPNDFNHQEFATYLKQSLKKEEIPAFMVVDKIPRLIPSDKVDRVYLRNQVDDKGNRYLLANGYVVAKNEFEESLLDLWKRVLEIEKIADDVDFILQGGHSFKSAELIFLINDTLYQGYKTHHFLSLPEITFSQMAKQIQSLMNGKNNSELLPLVSVRPLVTTKKNRKNLFFLPPLLGEGYFTYRAMAKDLSRIFPDLNMFGLSDPGIYNESFLPASFEEAINRYVDAIIKTQTKGPYQILGFSFGATFAYGVCQKLLEKGEQVEDLHLMDGFSPSIYQKLNAKNHVDVLSSIVNFVIELLNNDYYDEKIGDYNISALAKYPHRFQIDAVFNKLYQKVKSNEAKCLVQMAKTHLIFMGQILVPDKPMPIWAELYFSRCDQDYLSIIDKVDISPRSIDYGFYGWNDFFSQLRINDFAFKGTHLDILKPMVIGGFFRKVQDKFFKAKHLLGSPCPSSKYSINNGIITLKLYFLDAKDEKKIQLTLPNDFIIKQVFYFNQSYMRSGVFDRCFSQTMNVEIELPEAQFIKMIFWLQEIGIESRQKVDELQKSSLQLYPIEPIKVFLHFTYSMAINLTFGFKVPAKITDIIEVIYLKTNLLPINEHLLPDNLNLRLLSQKGWSDEVNNELHYAFFRKNPSVFEAFTSHEKEAFSFINALYP